MDRFLNEFQEFVQRCIDGQNSSNVTVIMHESYYEHTSDNEDKHITIKPRDVNKDLDNDKDLDDDGFDELDLGLFGLKGFKFTK